MKLNGSNFRKIYRNSLKRIPVVRNAVGSIKEYLRYHNKTYAKFQYPSWKRLARDEKELRIAVICDSLTWDNMSSQFDAVYLRPSDWLQKMETFKPDIFFCEATWEGIDMSWENQIYRNPIFKRDNRVVLKDILRYCREANIPTVFWNKEDDPQNRKKFVDFDSTALLFDHVFTTAVECIPKYTKMGHKSVSLMMFGFSPELFSKSEVPDNNRAVFFGSWYNDMPERCKDMQAVFDMVLSEGLNLVIYDRASESNNLNLKYPNKYKQYIKPAVAYNQINRIIEDSRYVININSIKDSKTMFARRVFEAMACGRIVISNESVGLRELFPESIWFVGEEFDYKNEKNIIEKNYDFITRNFTFKAQFMNALKNVDIIA